MDDDDHSGPKDPPDEKAGKGHLIVFPGGKSTSSGDIGANYVVGQGGHVNTPELLDPASIARENREREHFVATQELTVRVRENAAAADLMQSVLKEVAEELAHLKFERAKAAKEGKNTANYNMSRIASLKQIAEILMKRQENARAEQLDLKSPRFQAVMRAWMEFVYESMSKAGVKDTDIELTFAQMKADMVDWEKSILDIQS